MMIAWMLLLAIGDEITTKEYQVSDEQNYKIEFDHRGITSIAEKLEKGYSLGKFQKIEKEKTKDLKAATGSAPEKPQVSVTQFHGHLAEQMKQMGNQIEILGKSFAAQSLQKQEALIRDLRDEAIRARASLEDADVKPVIQVDRSWKNFETCVESAQVYVFEKRGDSAIGGCLELFPEGLIPATFEMDAWTDAQDTLLLYQDLLRYREATDLVWILPAFDRKLVGESKQAARELWIAMRYLRSQQSTFENGMLQIGMSLPSLKTEYQIPFVDRSTLRKEFCIKWKSVFLDQNEHLMIEGTTLCQGF